MTVREIAKLAGVSPSTVSRYFTGAENVSPEAAKSIREVLGEDGTVKTRSPKKKVVVLIVPQNSNAFYTELMYLFMESASQYGVTIVLWHIGNMDLNQHKTMLSKLNPCGVLLFEEDDRIPIHELAYKMNIPVVLCGEEATGIKGSVYVHVNDSVAAYEGTKYLLNLGHKKIAFFASHGKALNSSFLRLIGCRKALEEVGLSMTEVYVKYGNLSMDHGYRLAQEIVKEHLDFTAIFAFSDETACGAIHGLQDLGLRVPEEISVLGFDDLPLAERIRPRLTTLHQPLEDFVGCTLDYFLTGSMVKLGREILLPHTIMVRDSCMKMEEKKNEFYESHE